jgi:triosephosphate isomerase (TIM)
VASGKLIVGNWKMNGLLDSLEQAKIIARTAGSKNQVVICPPATLIAPMVAAVKGSGVGIGGQDCHGNASGAHTGDIAAAMLADAGATYVIVGHSERRTDHHETSDLVCAKAKAANDAGLTAIICVGESEAQRDAGDALSVVIEQIQASIPIDADADLLCIAYEPVWAIGTGRTPSLGDVEAMHEAIRTTLVSRFGSKAGAKVAILYGGSVNPKNCSELMGVKHVDGALVGGASLKAESFLAIVDA